MNFVFICFSAWRIIVHNTRSAFKARGNANNDWDVSLSLIKDSGSLAPEKIPTREDVVLVFEELYVSDAQRPGGFVSQSLPQLSRNRYQEGPQAQRESPFEPYLLCISQDKVQACHRHRQTPQGAESPLLFDACVLTRPIIRTAWSSCRCTL